MNEINPADFAHMRQQVNEMYIALVGDTISNNGGMVKRLDAVEARLGKVEKAGAKMGWHLKFLWTAAGGVLMAIYSLIIKK